MSKDGDRIHMANKLITGSMLPDCWKECLKTSNYMEKRESIEEFNKNSTSARKRGISIMPMKFSPTFGVKFLHQVRVSITSCSRFS